MPYGNRVKLILNAHYTHTRHIRLAKLHRFLYRRFYWKKMFNNIKEIIENCEVYNKIHLRIDYRHQRPIEAKITF